MLLALLPAVQCKRMDLTLQGASGVFFSVEANILKIKPEQYGS